jgi:hypothetical protein
MQYNAMRKYFHAFEAQGAVVGFDFVNEEDAINFHSRGVVKHDYFLRLPDAN